MPVISSSLDRPAMVSIVHLLTSPERYVNQRIAVTGYFGRDRRLFMTEDHAKISDTLSSIGVSDTDEGDLWRSSCLESYMRIAGKFVQMEPTPYSYGIVQVEEVYDPVKREICWEISKE
jgi:hypothetical protein